MVKTKKNQDKIKKVGKTVDISVKPKYTILVTKMWSHEKGGSKMDDLIEKIRKAEKVIAALTQLALSIGTLLAVTKMVIESLM